MELIVDGKQVRHLEKSGLTEREMETLILLGRGHSSKVIADILCLSKRTVDFHLSNVYQKLGVENRIQALLAAGSLRLDRRIPVTRSYGEVMQELELELISNCPEDRVGAENP